jgi:hypothetical protein
MQLNDVLVSMLAFFFWVMAIWIFIAISSAEFDALKAKAVAI